MNAEDRDPKAKRGSGADRRSGQDRRKADRRVSDIPVDEDRRKGPTRTGQDRRRRDRRQG